MFAIINLLSSLFLSSFLLRSIFWIHAYVYGRDIQQMEKFKACEKEMKTKAFSKEGLIQAAKLDPKEQEKEEAIQWVNHQVEMLQMQVETTEAELENLRGTGKKRNKGASGHSGRQEELERLNERRNWHMSRLEIVLRMLNNGSLSVDKVNELRDDVTYFVESNTVRVKLTFLELFWTLLQDENFQEVEGIYDDLNLEEEEEKFGLVAEDAESDDSDEASEGLNKSCVSNILLKGFQMYSHQRDQQRSMMMIARQVVKGTKVLF